MDRWLVFDGETPETVDILQSNKLNMIGLGFALQALLGTGVCVNGLACTQTSPLASKSVTIAPGTIYTQEAADATAYGAGGPFHGVGLTADTALVVKQGILYNSLNLTPVFTGTSGQSQVFLVEATFTDVDTGPTVIPYYNAASPKNPLWGPGLASTRSVGTTQPTIRSSICQVQLVAGTPATTGSQTAPAADSGWVGLFTITLAFGYTNITNANIVQLATAPFFPSLPAVPGGVQTLLWTFAQDTGTLNALAATIVPAPTALVAGLIVQVQVAHSNNGSATFNLNGLGAVTIKRGKGGANLNPGDLLVGEIATLGYDGAHWQLMNYPNTFSSIQTNTFTSLPVSYSIDFGTKNHIVVHANCNTPGGLGVHTPPGPITMLFTGLTMIVKVANSNTGPVDITINNLAPVAVVHQSTGLPLEWFSMVAGELLVLIYDGTVFRKLPRKNKFFSYTLTGSNQVFGLDADDHTRQLQLLGLAPLTLIPGEDEVGGPPFWFPPLGFFPVYGPPGGIFFWPLFLPSEFFFDEEDFDFLPEGFPGRIFPRSPSDPQALPLSVGDQLNVTFNNVRRLHYGVAVQPGIYEVEINITSSDTECCDFWHYPNDRDYDIDDRGGRHFHCFPHCCRDDDPGDDRRTFREDLFNDREDDDRAFGKHRCFHKRDDDDGPDDDGFEYGRPPFFIKFTFVTYPFCKHIRVSGGCFGGPFRHHCRWDDDEVPWFSLGTFSCALHSGLALAPRLRDRDDFEDDDFRAHISGVYVVRRLA